jgi:hypothetical protein
MFLMPPNKFTAIPSIYLATGMAKLAREILDEIMAVAISKCSLLELISFTTLNKAWGWKAVKVIYQEVDLRNLEQATKFLHVVADPHMGTTYPQLSETGLPFRRLVYRLRFFWDIGTIPERNRLPFRTSLAGALTGMMLWDFTFTFSEHDWSAMELIAGSDIKCSTIAVRMISVECIERKVRDRPWCVDE